MALNKIRVMGTHITFVSVQNAAECTLFARTMSALNVVDAKGVDDEQIEERYYSG